MCARYAPGQIFTPPLRPKHKYSGPVTNIRFDVDLYCESCGDLAEVVALLDVAEVVALLDALPTVDTVKDKRCGTETRRVICKMW